MPLATEKIDTPSAPDGVALVLGASDGKSLALSTHGGPDSTAILVEAISAPVRFPEAQAVYLRSRIPDYKRSQADKSWDDAWASIHGGFINEWPQGPLTAAEIASGITREAKLIQELRVNLQFPHE